MVLTGSEVQEPHKNWYKNNGKVFITLLTGGRNSISEFRPGIRIMREMYALPLLGVT